MKSLGHDSTIMSSIFRFSLSTEQNFGSMIKIKECSEAREKQGQSPRRLWVKSVEFGRSDSSETEIAEVFDSSHWFS